MIVFISILAVALFAFYWNATLAPKKISEAKVTDFTMSGGGLPAIVGVTVAINFNVTVKNTGTENISQLNVKLSMVNNETNIPISDYNLYYYEPVNFTLNSGEVSLRKIDFFVDLETGQRMIASHQNFLAALISNGTVLDERKLL